MDCTLHWQIVMMEVSVINRNQLYGFVKDFAVLRSLKLLSIFIVYHMHFVDESHSVGIEMLGTILQS